MTPFHCISAPLGASSAEPTALKVDVLDHRSGVAHLCAGYDIGPDDWPDGYGISNETVTLSTHQGTHIDAPAHYGPGGEGVAQADIANFMGCAVVFADLAEGACEVRLDFGQLRGRLDRWAGVANAVFFVTGAWRRWGDESYFRQFKGIPVAYIEAALDRGYRLIGTDAFSLDPPFEAMCRAFLRNRNPAALWPAHVLGRRRPYYQLERLYAMDPFQDAELLEYIALPIKLPCGAAWARAVARRVA